MGVVGVPCWAYPLLAERGCVNHLKDFSYLSADLSQTHSDDASPNEPASATPSSCATEHSILSLQVPSSLTFKTIGGDTLRTRADSFNSTAETSRSRANSFNSKAKTARSRGNSDLTSLRLRFEGDELTTEESLRPDKAAEKDFEVDNSPFAFSPGQLNKTLNPKSLAVYRTLGGIYGLERGLKTDLLAVDGHFYERKRIFNDNRLPAKKAISIWRLSWNAYNDRVLIILTIAAVVSLALGMYEAVGQPHDPSEGQPVDWVEGLTIEVAVVIVVLVTGLNDYRREKQFLKLNFGRMIVKYTYWWHGVRCDESLATGESDAMKKTAGSEVWQRMVEGTATSKLDPFIISGSKVLEGVGTYLVTSVGVNSSFGKIIMVRNQLKDMVSSVEETLADKTDEVFMQIKRDYRAVLGGGDSPQGEVLPRVQRLVRKDIKKPIEGAERVMNIVLGYEVEDLPDPVEDAEDPVKGEHEGDAAANDIKAEKQEMPVPASTSSDVKEDAADAVDDFLQLPASISSPREDSVDTGVKSEVEDNQLADVTDANSGTDAASDSENEEANVEEDSDSGDD
ncbi:MAG: hypothetical protein Q9226_006230 [Calogaya cf. arnoldii]